MKNLTAILGAVAPTLATAMGGPLGGMALKMVADKLGLPESTMDAVEAAVTGGVRALIAAPALVPPAALRFHALQAVELSGTPRRFRQADVAGEEAPTT